MCLLFAVLWLNGVSLGPTDDEAYYWVLAQRPAWGYAYHPPMVAWLIAVSQWLWPHSVALRFPAAACVAIFTGLALKWLERAGADERGVRRGSLALFSFAGLYALAWMMVPDDPLFVGYMVMFYFCWRICFGDRSGSALFWLAFGAAFTVLSKYSGVLSVFSAFICVWVHLRGRARVRALSVLCAGTLSGLIPILFWNSRHEWASILYQIQARHEGGSLSWLRFARFWLIEFVIAGPGLFYMAFTLWKRKEPVFRFLFIWMFPAALVFCVQPLFSDFKPHWAFVVWWPAALGLAYLIAKDPRGLFTPLAQVQIGYGFSVIAVVWLACHVPIGGHLIQWSTNSQRPLLDVTNDLYGWDELPALIAEKTPGGEVLPLIGSRYQTAAQAAFARRDFVNTALVPRDIKARDEWPGLSAVRGYGPEWPRLNSPVLYVSDNRYDEPPGFPGASCSILGKVTRMRAGILAKTIELWKCEPGPR